MAKKRTNSIVPKLLIGVCGFYLILSLMASILYVKTKYLGFGFMVMDFKLLAILFLMLALYENKRVKK